MTMPEVGTGVSGISGSLESRREQMERVARLCQKDLRFLCKHVMWGNRPDKYWSKFHDDLAVFMERPSKRKLILVPRGHLKSEVLTKGKSIQKVLNNPNIRILIANDTWDNAKKYLRTIQAYLRNGSGLATVFGSFQSELWNQDECTVRQRKEILDAPTWATTGVEKEQTGQHYDLIIADDIVARDNVKTPEQIEKVKLYYKDLLDLLEPKGELWVIGTRWHQNDLYSDLLEDENFDKFFRSAYYENGEPIFAEKFTKEYLALLRFAKGAYEFSAQYLNNPIDESAADFKASWIKFYDPTKVPPLSLYLTVDPAISLSRDADFTAMVVAGMSPERVVYVVDRVHRRMVPSDLINTIFELVGKWKLTRVGLETIAFQLTLKYDLQAEMRRRGKFFTVDEMGKRDKQEKKEARIRRLQPYFEQGLVYLRHDMQDVVDELLAFPRGKHDDLIDALAYQLDYLVPGTAHVPTSEMHPMSWKAIHQRTMEENQDSGLYSRFMSDLRTRAA